jgi:hypothetical protein
VSRLSAVLERLGWRLVFSLEPVDPDLDRFLADPLR